MKSSIKNSLLIIISILILSSCTNSTDSNLKLWYDHPANASAQDDPNGWKDDAHWLEALPLGNGSLGAMVFGDVNTERIQLSEESMWSGSPDDNDNPEAAGYVEEIRDLLFAGKYKEATDLVNQTQICKGAGTGHGNGASVPFGCFQTLGDLRIENGSSASYENYRRELDLNDAVVRVSYTQNEVDFTREIFVSQPDQVMVAKFKANKAGQISFTCTLDRPERFETYIENDQLIMSGSLKDGKGGNGLQYMTRLKADTKNGSIELSDNKLIINK